MFRKRNGAIDQEPATAEIGSSQMQSLYGEDIAPLLETMEDLHHRKLITDLQRNQILNILLYGE